MFVKLTTQGTAHPRSYITWCTRGNFRLFASHVNNRTVICNDRVTRALDNGARFLCTSVCDDVGFLRMQELDDVLYLLEGYIDGYGTRTPRGLNSDEVVHVYHRSLYHMGGNRVALQVYTKWKDAVQRTLLRVEKVKVCVKESLEALKACQEWEEKGTDFDLTEAFCVKWETKCTEAFSELARAEREFTAVWKLRRQLSGIIVTALADAYLHFTTQPTHLLELRETLNAPEPDHVAQVRASVNDLRRLLAGRNMSVRNALIELELWDGKKSMPFFCRETVNQAFGRIARRTHPDKNPNPAEHERPARFQEARDCLRNYLDMKEGKK